MENQPLTPKAVFDHAHELRSPAERQAYLDQACAGDAELRQKVEGLLRAYDEAGSFLGKPAVEPAATGSFHPREQGTESEISPETTADHPLVEGPGTRIGPYKLLQPLGEGGMGAVFLAEQEQPVRRKVALKLIKPGMDSGQVVARFEAERQALALMDHSNIAKVYDAGTTVRGLPYFVMELVPGEPMTRYCDAHTLTLRERLELFVPVCRAIAHAHQQGIIHRDIKPSNVLVTLADGKPVPKVIDFGIAKATAQPLTEHTLFTQFGGIMGTFPYMSPEQAENGVLGIDTRSDVYSLGAVLYELLTGTTPLERQRLKEAALTEKVRMIVEDEPPRPSARLAGAGERLATIAARRGAEAAKLVRQVRGELDWIVMRALEKDRNRRYESPGALARDVEHYLADEPVEACPPSVRYRVGKFARKHRTLTGFVALLLLGVAGLVAGIFVVNGERKRAETALVAETTWRKQTRAALNTTDSLVGELIGRHDKLGAEETALLHTLLRGYEQFAAELGETAEAREVAAEGQLRVALIRAALGEPLKAKEGFGLAIQRYQQLLADYPAVRDYRHGLARCHLQRGLASADLFKHTEAEADYGLALDLLRALASEDRARREYRDDLAKCYNDLGLVLRDSMKRTAAETAFRRAIDLREQLANDFPDKPEARSELAGSYNNLGMLLTDPAYKDSDKGADAGEAIQRAHKLLTQLIAEFPTVPRYQDALADMYNNEGRHLSQDRRQQSQALSAYQQAIDLRQQLVAKYPIRPDYRFALAKSHFNRAALLNELGPPAKAVEAYREAITLLEKLVRDHPNSPDYRQDLADGYSNLGALLSDQGKRPEAEKVVRQAVGGMEKLTAEFPFPKYRSNLAGKYSNLGNVVRDQGRPAAALDCYQKAFDTISALSEREREAANVRLVQRNAYWDRANARGQLGQHAEAIEDWQHAIDLDAGADRESLRCFQRTAEAEVKLQAAAARGHGAVGGSLCYEAARVHAQAVKEAAKTSEPSLQTQYTRRVVGLLKQAAAAQFFRNARQVEELKKDSRFDPLRPEREFKDFLKSLEVPTPK